MHSTVAVPLLDLARRFIHQTAAQTLTVVAADRPGSYDLTIERADRLVTAMQFADLPTLAREERTSRYPSPMPRRLLDSATTFRIHMPSTGMSYGSQPPCVSNQQCDRTDAVLEQAGEGYAVLPHAFVRAAKSRLGA
jgi:hypothetical protein